MALWAARLAAPVPPVRLAATRTASGLALSGLSGDTFRPGDTFLLLADPFTLPVDAIVDALGELDARPSPWWAGWRPPRPVPGGNRLVLDGEVHDSGGVGVVPAEVATTVVVSQGCRPVGEPMIVTRAEGNLLVELAGRSAIDRLEEVVEAAGPDELLGWPPARGHRRGRAPHDVRGRRLRGPQRRGRRCRRRAWQWPVAGTRGHHGPVPGAGRRRGRRDAGAHGRDHRRRSPGVHLQRAG